MTPCRLCAGQTRLQWTCKVLGKYDVGYWECAGCGSLQTDTPSWLDEAYATTGTGFDTGAAERSIGCALTLSTALEVLNFDPAGECLDYGAGVGLFARMMRDRGWRFSAYEKYTAPFFMDQFLARPDDRTWDLITAYEVFEHLPAPAAELAVILGCARTFVFFTTDPWEQQGPDWDYLNPEQGQHVFFYSGKALHMIAGRHGFEYHDLGFVRCFARPGALARLKALTSEVFGQQILDAFLRHTEDPYKFATLDHVELRRAQGKD